MRISGFVRLQGFGRHTSRQGTTPTAYVPLPLSRSIYNEQITEDLGFVASMEVQVVDNGMLAETPPTATFDLGLVSQPVS